MEFEAGPITAFVEACATAIGVGMVLGGFAAGLVGVLRGTARETLELRALVVGYAFAASCLVARLVDVLATI